MNATQIQKRIQELQAQKEEMILRDSSIERAREEFEKQWAITEETRRNEFEIYISRMKQVTKLENDILISIKDFVPDEVYDHLNTGFPRIRVSDNLLQLNGIHHRYRDNYQLRQLLKLIFAVYRYNRDIIFNTIPTSAIKSRLKHASSCPECGEIAKQVFMNMTQGKVISLP